MTFFIVFDTEENKPVCKKYQPILYKTLKNAQDSCDRKNNYLSKIKKVRQDRYIVHEMHMLSLSQVLDVIIYAYSKGVFGEDIPTAEELLNEL